MRREAAVERVKNGLSDRFAFCVEGDLTTSRAGMAGILAALQNIDTFISAAIGADSQSVLNDLKRLSGDSHLFLESTGYPDLLEPSFQLLHIRMELGSKTIFYKVRAHCALLLREIADQQADKGHTFNHWIGRYVLQMAVL